VRSFPANLTAMMFGYKPKPNFTVENEAAISKPPSVDFAPAAPPPAAAPSSPAAAPSPPAAAPSPPAAAPSPPAAAPSH
jgi:LemA protein